MQAGRLKALLRATTDVQQATQQRNTQLLHVAPPRECNTQQMRAFEVRRLITAIAKANASYWTPADVEEACVIAEADLDGALVCWRAIADDYGISLSAVGAGN
jgi:hypothetical protein